MSIFLKKKQCLQAILAPSSFAVNYLHCASFLCLSIFVSTTNSWSVCLGLDGCGYHPLPNGPPDLQTTSIMSTYHMKPPSQKVPTLCWIAGTHRNGCLRNQVSYGHHIKCPSNLKDLAVSQSGTYVWHTIGTLADSQIPLQFPTKYWFGLGPNFGGDGSLDHAYGGSFAMISTGSLAKPGHCPPVLLRAASLQRKRTLQRRRQ